MELVFIRHGQGEHTLEPPKSFQLSDPSLTEIGILQAMKLRKALPLSADDVIIISPMRRTIQTAINWVGNVNCQMIVHPVVGPRMFPLLSTDKAFKCDDTLGMGAIEVDYPQLRLVDLPEKVWKRGINAIAEEEFCLLAKQFLEWCRQLDKNTIYIVSHDGTITSHRAQLGESVTRKDFLGETGFYRVEIYC
jgi:broad specificity phosphatase PhoE